MIEVIAGGIVATMQQEHSIWYSPSLKFPLYSVHSSRPPTDVYFSVALLGKACRPDDAAILPGDGVLLYSTLNRARYGAVVCGHERLAANDAGFFSDVDHSEIYHARENAQGAKT